MASRDPQPFEAPLRVKWFLLLLLFLPLIGHTAELDNGAASPETSSIPEAGTSLMPLYAYTDKTSHLYGVAAFYYLDGRPGFKTGLNGITNGDNFHSVAFDVDQRTAEGWDLGFHSWSARTFDAYYGEGSRTDASKGYSFRMDRVELGVWGLKPLGNHWALGPQAVLQFRQERDTQTLKGVPVGQLFADGANPGLGLRLTKDSRDSQLSASNGLLGSVDLLAYPAVLNLMGGASNEALAQVDARHYQTVFFGWVWGQRVGGAWSTGGLGYQDRLRLGGTDILRGFEENRFRGRWSYYAQEELRMRLWRQLFGAISADIGEAGDGQPSGPRSSVQVGIRIGLPPDYGVKLRMDAGFGDDGESSVAMQFGESF